MNFKNTVQTAKRVLVACGLMGSLAAGAPARRQATPSQSTAPVARVTQLLAECSYQYTKAAEAVWVVPFQGKSLGSFKVIVTTQQGMLVVFVIVASKADLNLTPEAMEKLLKFNHRVDRVKIGLDDDGDTFVRVDLSLRVLDAQEFKLNVEQVAAGADEVFAGIQTFLKSPKNAGR